MIRYYVTNSAFLAAWSRHDGISRMRLVAASQCETIEYYLDLVALIYLLWLEVEAELGQLNYLVRWGEITGTTTAGGPYHTHASLSMLRLSFLSPDYQLSTLFCISISMQIPADSNWTRQLSTKYSVLCAECKEQKSKNPLHEMTYELMSLNVQVTTVCTASGV